MKRLIAISIVLGLSGCVTNQYDAQIAIADAAVLVEKEKAYAAGMQYANEPAVLVKIMGELKCSPEQKASGECGTIVYNPNFRQIAPERDKGDLEVAGNALVGVIEALTPFGIARETRKGIVALAGDGGGNNSGNTSIITADGGNTSSTTTTADGGNTQISEANTTKTAGADLADTGASIDKGTSSNSEANINNTAGADLAGTSIDKGTSSEINEANVSEANITNPAEDPVVAP